MTIEHGATPLKFIVMRGPGPRVKSLMGSSRELASGTFHLSHVVRPVQVGFEFPERSEPREHEQLSLELEPSRLRELLGTPVLPRAVERVLAGEWPSPGEAVSAATSRVLEEILYCDAKGGARQLYLEAKGLELLANLISALEDLEQAASPNLSQYDRDRLETARQILVARRQDPPTLPELARRAGLNEAKLKAGFRTLFGSTVYGYLREYRMEEARRLLLARRHSVSEVAAEVGYANPSKFAAAFRRKFGMSPSSVV